MKFYKIDIKSFYGNRVASDANFIDNSEEVFFKQIALGEIIENISIFNYFFLESYDEKKYWEWALFDVHKFIGESSIMLGSWLVSKKTKELFNKFKISSPHTFYPSKLMYKNKKKIFIFFNLQENYCTKVLLNRLIFNVQYF
ncbi:hypothetical protein ACI760_10330 [Capnocytophaga canimorsus]|uniref:hypothetical protein n=1 Tax=Capnocytophaga canimorsus TaxID=28188 RepID=UPI0038586FF5